MVTDDEWRKDVEMNRWGKTTIFEKQVQITADELEHMIERYNDEPDNLPLHLTKVKTMRRVDKLPDDESADDEADIEFMLFGEKRERTGEVANEGHFGSLWYSKTFQGNAFVKATCNYAQFIWPVIYFQRFGRRYFDLSFQFDTQEALEMEKEGLLLKPWDMIQNLSDDDRILLQFLCAGLNDFEIARKFAVTEKTIQNSLSKLRRKYGKDMVPTRRMLKNMGIYVRKRSLGKQG
jgi:hypothetical protein